MEAGSRGVAGGSGGRPNSGGRVWTGRSGGDDVDGWVVVDNQWVGLVVGTSHRSG
jgi:hypothetical protein